MKIHDLLSKLGIEYLESGNPHCRPGWIQLRECPFCGSTNYHLGYNLQAGYFNCWRCAAHHTIAVLCKLGLAHNEATEFWKSGDHLERIDTRPRAGLKEPLGRGRFYHSHKEYLRGRGFDPDELQRLWHLEGIGHRSTRLSWRIYIPIELNGQRVSWTTRAIGEKVKQRYVSASAQEEAINAKTLVYGIDYCCHSIVIVEGPADAWRIGPGAGALLGTAFSSGQVKRLIRVPYRFVCFDNSREAQAKARELASQLAPFPGETSIMQIDAKDPGELSPKQVAVIRKAARL